MNSKFLSLCSGIALVLMGTPGNVNARGVGSNPPLLGDAKTAYQYIYLGDTAAAKDEWKNARTYYQLALASSPFIQEATIGLARCDAAGGDFQAAVLKYDKAIGSDNYDIDYVTEYILVLQQAGKISQAISRFNAVLKLCKTGYSVTRMDIYPSDFRTDMSNYDANQMSAMTHLMRALNASNGDENRISKKLAEAKEFAPTSKFVSHYETILFPKSKCPSTSGPTNSHV